MPSLYSLSLGLGHTYLAKSAKGHFGITFYNTIFFYKKQARLPPLILLFWFPAYRLISSLYPDAGLSLINLYL